MDILGLLSKSCDDLIIRKGIIRQRSNKKSTLFEIDCREIVGENTILLSDIATKEKLLTPFRKQSVDVNLIIEENGFIFHDEYSKIRHDRPFERYLQNPFIEEKDLLERIDMDNNIKIISGKFERHILDRMSIWTDILSATQLRVDFDGSSAIFTVRPSDSANTTLGTLLILDGIEQPLEGYSGYAVEPFQANVENFAVDFWKQKSGIILMKLSSFIDSEEKVPLTIYGLSGLVVPNT